MDALQRRKVSSQDISAFRRKPITLKGKIFIQFDSINDEDLPFKIVGLEDGEGESFSFKILFVDCGSDFILVDEDELFRMLRQFDSDFLDFLTIIFIMCVDFHYYYTHCTFLGRVFKQFRRTLRLPPLDQKIANQVCVGHRLFRVKLVTRAC